MVSLRRIALAGFAAVALLPGLKARVPRGLLLSGAGVCAVSIASLLLNETSLPTFLVAQRGYVITFAAVLALGAARSFLGRDDLHALLVKTGLLSCAICVLQRVFLVPTVDDSEAGDRVTGLFAVDFIMLFYHLVCIGIVIAYWIRGRRILDLPPTLFPRRLSWRWGCQSEGSESSICGAARLPAGAEAPSPPAARRRPVRLGRTPRAHGRHLRPI
jgi:hypothetical protein